MQIQLNKKYDVKNLEGMTLHTILTALTDAERLYKKTGMTGLADNAAEAYKTILASTIETD